MENQYRRQISAPGVPGMGARVISPSGEMEEIRTLCIVGLPEDVQERELRNLFRFYPAYRGCILSEKKGRFGGNLAFALFESQAAAIEAKAVLDATYFDQSNPNGPRLSVHLAKKNVNPRLLKEVRLLSSKPPESRSQYLGHGPDMSNGRPLEHSYSQTAVYNGLATEDVPTGVRRSSYPTSPLDPALTADDFQYYGTDRPPVLRDSVGSGRPAAAEMSYSGMMGMGEGAGRSRALSDYGAITPARWSTASNAAPAAGLKGADDYPIRFPTMDNTLMGRHKGDLPHDMLYRPPVVQQNQVDVRYAPWI